MLNSKAKASYYLLTETQAMSSMAGVHIETDTSRVILEADKMAEASGNNMTVVRSKVSGLCVFSEFQVQVRKDEIEECLYSTDHGFTYNVHDEAA